MKTVPEVLREAAARVNEGWGRESYHNRLTNNVCAMGAICHSLFGDARYFYTHSNALVISNSLLDKTCTALASVMKEQFGPSSNHEGVNLIVTLNDDPRVNKEDIMACMEKAAIQAEEQV